jgi:hypothetical protein
MLDVPCGCELQAEAERFADDDPRRATYLADAKLLRVRWRCPAAGYPAPDAGDERHLDPEVRGVLEQVRRTTGVRDIHGCPGYLTAIPGAKAALRAYECQKNRCVRECLGTPPRALMDAAHAVGRGANAAVAEDGRRAKSKAERPPPRAGVPTARPPPAPPPPPAKPSLSDD